MRLAIRKHAQKARAIIRQVKQKQDQSQTRYQNKSIKPNHTSNHNCSKGQGSENMREKGAYGYKQPEMDFKGQRVSAEGLGGGRGG